MRDQERDRRKPNQGILSAGGDYIFLLDDDDQFLADRSTVAYLCCEVVDMTRCLKERSGFTQIGELAICDGAS